MGGLLRGVQLDLVLLGHLLLAKVHAREHVLALVGLNWHLLSLVHEAEGILTLRLVLLGLHGIVSEEIHQALTTLGCLLLNLDLRLLLMGLNGSRSLPLVSLQLSCTLRSCLQAQSCRSSRFILGLLLLFKLLLLLGFLLGLLPLFLRIVAVVGVIAIIIRVTLLLDGFGVFLPLVLLLFLLRRLQLRRRALSLGVWVIARGSELLLVVVPKLGDVLASEAAVLVLRAGGGCGRGLFVFVGR